MAKLTDEMKQMINTYQCYVATVLSDGTPNIGPKRSTRVFDDETLIWSEGTGRHTFEAIQQNPRVAIAVINPEIPDGYRFVGTATIHESGPAYERAAEVSKQMGKPAPKAAVTVRVEAIYTLKPGPTAGTQIA